MSEYEVIARQLMKNILYDNGCVDRFHPETEKMYKPTHLNKITAACEQFFTAHPEFITDDDLDDMACGEQEENANKYGVYPEYRALDEALNKYFDMV